LRSISGHVAIVQLFAMTLLLLTRHVAPWLIARLCAKRIIRSSELLSRRITNPTHEHGRLQI
jgi:hypothetical protein